MTLEDDELEIVLMALRNTHEDAINAQDNLPHPLRFVSSKCKELIERIEQHQEDRKNGDV